MDAFAARPIKELAVPRLHQRGFVAVRRAVKGGLRSNFSAISTSRRSASEREGLSGWRLAHASTSAVNAGGARKASIGSLPVAGRPRFLGITFLLDIFPMAGYYLNLRADAKRQTSHRPQPKPRRHPWPRTANPLSAAQMHESS